MKSISEIDKNFAVPATVDSENTVWYDAGENSEEIVIYGAYSKNPYLRMPADIAEQVSEGVAALNTNTAGIRARLACDSPYIAIRVEYESFGYSPHMTSLNQAGFDLYSADGEECVFVKPLVPPGAISKNQDGYVAVIKGLSGYHDYIINFPCYNDVKRLLIGVSKTAKLGKPRSYRDIAPVVFYGSSITQGGCASRPGLIYQNYLSRWLDIDYINLGFSGNGKAEQIMADYLAGLNMSVFVSDYDHNAPSVEHLKVTHYNLYRTIRAKNPALPYIMISKPDYKRWVEADVIKKEIIKESYRRGIEEGDKNLYFIDGESFFGDFERFAHTVDGCHPNDLGFFKMARGIYPTLEKILGGGRVKL